MVRLLDTDAAFRILHNLSEQELYPAVQTMLQDPEGLWYIKILAPSAKTGELELLDQWILNGRFEIYLGVEAN